MAKKTDCSYEEAVARLEEIIRRIENNELTIDSLGENLKEAQRLITFCREKLGKTDEQVKRILGTVDAE